MDLPLCLLRSNFTALVVAAVAMFVTSVADTHAQPVLTIGIRSDAAPFATDTPRAFLQPDRTSRFLEDADGTEYGGYVIEICVAALLAMEASGTFTYEVKVIDEARSRFDLLEEGAFDILCDPATITGDRLAAPGILVSQPLYLSGIGIARATLQTPWNWHWPCTGALIGVVEGTTSQSGIIEQMAREELFDNQFSSRLLEGGLAEEHFSNCEQYAAEDDSNELRRVLPASAPPPPKIEVFNSHRSLAAALCRQEILFSIGDLEIISRALTFQRETADEDCSFEVDRRVVSQERYGIYARFSQNEIEKNVLLLDFFRSLSRTIHRGRDSILVEAFRDYFDVSEISQSLDVFYTNVIASE